MTFYDICWIAFMLIMGLHYIYLVLDDDSKYQKNRFRKSIEEVYKSIVFMHEERNAEEKVIYKNKEFSVGIIKKEHNNRYTTYELFINGDEAGIFHIVGDCCRSYYYFETQNNRYKSEVMAIIRATAKAIKKNAKATVEKTNSWNEYSYFK